jgi:hypothetical protein
MSAALQLPRFSEPDDQEFNAQQQERRSDPLPTAKFGIRQERLPQSSPNISLAFYRKHTEKMLRRYLYASMQVGRAPSILGDPIARGWVSSRPIRTFEDAIIFVLDVERCLNHLGPLDRKILCRVVIQEYTQAEAAILLGMAVRTMSYKYPLAVDQLTEKLLEAGLLLLPG